MQQFKEHPLCFSTDEFGGAGYVAPERGNEIAFKELNFKLNVY